LLKRRGFIVAVAAVIVFDGRLAGVARAAGTPNLSDFLPDLVMERENAANTILKLHQTYKDSPGDLDAADSRYADLVAGVNGFLKSVALQIEINQMNLERWKSDSAVLLAKAKEFDASAGAVARKQASSSDSIGATRGAPSRGGAPGESKPGVALTFDPVATGLNLVKGLQDMKRSGQAFDDAQRKSLADSIRNNSLWYDLDSALKRSPAVTASPQSATPRPQR